MNPIDKFQRSWSLLRRSLSIIGRHKELLVFPIVIFVCTTVIVLFFLAPAVLRPTGHSPLTAEHWQAISNSLFTHSASSTGANGKELTFTPAAMAYLVFLYFVSMFLATFFNVAFYHEILAALGGDAVSISRGLKFAGTKWKSILMWSLFAGLIGVIIKLIEQRFELVGRIIARLIGLAWSVTAVFVIPIIVSEEHDANPFNMLRRSAGILKKTWGEALIGYAGLTFVNVLIGIVSAMVLVGAFAVSAALHTFWIAALAFVSWILAMFVWNYFVGVASQVYKGALYLYAAQGVVAEPYDREMLEQAWKYRK